MKYSLKNLLLLPLLAVLTLSCCSKAGEERPQLPDDALALASPDGRLTLRFGLDVDGSPVYTLDRGETAVVLPSRLGYDLMDGRELRTGFVLESESRDALDETWQPVWGEEESIRNHYNELLVCLGREDGVKMHIRFRLYDDGLGFRYEFPMENALTYFKVKEERTEFAMAGDHTAWWISGDYDTQEYNYTESRLSEIRGISEETRAYNASQTGFSPTGVQTALQMKTEDGLYVNIHEAAVLDYPTTNLDLDDKTFVFTTDPGRPGREGTPAGPLRQPLAHRPGLRHRGGSAGEPPDPQSQRALRAGGHLLDPPDQVHGCLVGAHLRPQRMVLHL